MSKAPNPAAKRLPPLEGRAAVPQDEDGPVFAAPWEAKAFAFALGLCEQGRYGWKEFQHHLIGQIAADEAAAKARGEAPPGYYHSFLAAALALFAEKDLLSRDELEAKVAELRAS